MKLIMYSTGCPKCKVLEAKLMQKNLQFDVITSIDDMKKLGIGEVPMLSVDGELLNFTSAIKFVNER